AVALEQQYGVELSPAIFFEYSDLNGLAKYLAEQHSRPIATYYQDQLGSTKAIPQTIVPKPVAPISVQPTQPQETQAVAIIGISGIMPQSPDVETFWQHLAAGHDLITEIPPERWDWRTFYDPSGQDPLKAHSKWGGFIPDVDKFDAAFFNISPREAAMMDPQHRLFLQSVWHCIEDAGYRASDWTGRSVGVYVGVQFQEYQTLITQSLGHSNAQVATGNAHAMLANRVSFLLDLRGPSEAIDTACSSSLVALHRAVQSIRSGEIESAIVGGVSLALSPETYVTTSQMGVLSPDGRCKTFDQTANGYVKGEGVGVVLLKPLAQAQYDGDSIYAIIRGSAENHGGRATSLTAPNSQAQAQLLIKAYQDAGVEIETVSYIETHGTGTELGDPVEIEGLKRGFTQLSERQDQSLVRHHYCGLGSVKSNIGHLEPAAGIAGLLKVLLAMKHQTLPATINFKEQNPYIDLTDSPFYLATESQVWQPLTDVNGQPLPRRAGVSSFGFGGAYAHVVLEEYQGAGVRDAQREPGKEPQLIVLSARNKERLRAYARKLLSFLEKASGPVEPGVDTLVIERAVREMTAKIMDVAPADIETEQPFEAYGFDPVQLSCLKSLVEERYQCNLPLTLFSNPLFSEPASVGRVVQYITSLQAEDKPINQVAPQLAPSLTGIAYTLQVGREAMEERLALVVSSIEELVERLNQFIQNQTTIENLYQGNTTTSKLKSELLIGGRAGEAFIQIALDDRDIDRLAQLWVSGIEIEWLLLYGAQKPDRISLPTYPFAKERYWFDEYRKRQQVMPRPGGLADVQNDKKLVLKPTQTIGLSQVEHQERNEPPLPTLSRTGAVPVDISANKKHSQIVTTVQERSGVSEFDIRNSVKELVIATLYLEGTVAEDRPFNELGMDSITGVEFVKALNQIFPVTIKVGKLYDYPTVKEMSTYIASLINKRDLPLNHDAGAGEGTNDDHFNDLSAPDTTLAVNQGEQRIEEVAPQPDVSTDIQETDVAVIGMSGRFPGAANLAEYWHNLKEGLCAITEIPPERWEVTRFYDPDRQAPTKSYSKWGGFLTDIDTFDPLFFNISPAEAEVMDPQQRLVLEEAYHALEDAGYGQRSAARRACGLYVGLMGGNEYRSRLAQTHLAQAAMGNAGSILAGRVAYAFDLQGPVITVDTACSSSLVAVDMACKSLINREAELMLAGGVTLYLTEQPYLDMSKAQMLSPKGLCKTFDDQADGFVPGEGVGFVVLKLLSRAMADGDPIYGIIKGSGVNQDGRTNGLTAPNVKS
ncbi:MAG: hypothetical protein GY934_10375, partial [Gammaproteobacteria bacterium]|nr:hypothetical protein [Gammaproteobacteria bacterium]